MVFHPLAFANGTVTKTQSISKMLMLAVWLMSKGKVTLKSTLELCLPCITFHQQVLFLLQHRVYTVYTIFSTLTWGCIFFLWKIQPNGWIVKANFMGSNIENWKKKTNKQLFSCLFKTHLLVPSFWSSFNARAQVVVSNILCNNLVLLL